MDRDCGEKSEPHTDDLKTDEIADLFDQPGAFQLSAIDRLETQFFG
jgi:hypothetical protein